MQWNLIYFEATYNGDKQELYLDVYKKQKNICIPWSKNSEEGEL